jgi:ATP synthase mitochondrial F1 complex assembly factor 2
MALNAACRLCSAATLQRLEALVVLPVRRVGTVFSCCLQRTQSQCIAFDVVGAACVLLGNRVTGISRFYKHVSVADIVSEDGSESGDKLYAVTLDGKTLKTPMRTPLRLPNKAMAVAIAREWDAQEERIKPALMPIMTLASTVLDLDKTSSKESLVAEMVHYLNSDTLCYQVTADQQDKLSALQHKKWDPIRKWFVEQFEGELDVAHGSIGRLTHDQSVIDGIRTELLKVQ